MIDTLLKLRDFEDLSLVQKGGSYTDSIKLLSYNVLYKSFTFGESKGSKNKKPFGNNIIKYINKSTPDIMVLCEASPLTPKSNIGKKYWYKQITLPNYKTNIAHHSKRGSGGTVIYWSDKFRKDDSVSPYGLSISKTKIITGYERPCIGVKLIHKKTGKKYIIIGVHYEHHLNNSNVAIKAINKILTRLKFNKSSDKVLIMGDHNEFYDDFKIKTINVKGIRLKLKTINPKNGKPYNTCCGDEDAKTKKCYTGDWKFPFDLAYSNISHMTIKVDPTITSRYKMCESKPKKFKNSTHSDHYPIIGKFEIK